MIKNLIFDYGGVILALEHELMAAAFARLGIPDMLSRVSLAAQSHLFDNFDTGALTPEEFRETIRELANQATTREETPDTTRALSDAEIDDAWNAMLIGIPPENLELLLQAQGRYRTFLLSNTNNIHLHWISQHLKRTFDIDSIAPYFEQVWYSNELGMRKPNCDIFEYALTTAGLDPGETLFMDDNPQNIAAAADLGIRTRLVAKGEPLKDVLAPFLAP